MIALDDPTLMGLILKVPRLRASVLGVRCPFLFSSREYNVLYQKLCDYNAKYPQFEPSELLLESLVQGSGIDLSQILGEIRSSDADSLTHLSEEEFDDLLLSRANYIFSIFCVRSKVGKSPRDYLRLVADAKKQIPASFFKKAEIVSQLSNVLERLSFNFEVMSPFGIKSLDTLLNGGLFPGEAALIIGPKNVGKTFFGVNIAKWNLLSGNLVLFFTMETRKTFVLRRLDSCLFKFKPELFDRITHKSKEDFIRFLKTFQNALELVKPFLLGDIVVFDYPADYLTCERILHDIGTVEKQKNRSVDTIIVDYLEIMRGPKDSEAKRMELASIANELRAIAQKKDCSVFVLSQGNRQSRKALYVDATHSSESWAKPFAFDFVLGLSEDAQDPNKRYIYLADSRRTVKKIAFTCETNFFVSQWSEYGA